MKAPIVLLNVPVLSTHGEFRFSAITADEAKALIAERGYRSAIGHVGSAEVLQHVLGVPVEMNRITIRQEVGEDIILLRLLTRQAEGVVLSASELTEKDWELGLLERLS